jgi:hypothetical protein
MKRLKSILYGRGNDVSGYPESTITVKSTCTLQRQSLIFYKEHFTNEEMASVNFA